MVPAEVVGVCAVLRAGEVRREKSGEELGGEVGVDSWAEADLVELVKGGLVRGLGGGSGGGYLEIELEEKVGEVERAFFPTEDVPGGGPIRESTVERP